MNEVIFLTPLSGIVRIKAGIQQTKPMNINKYISYIYPRQSFYTE